MHLSVASKSARSTSEATEAITFASCASCATWGLKFTSSIATLCLGNKDPGVNMDGSWKLEKNTNKNTCPSKKVCPTPNLLLGPFLLVKTNNLRKLSFMLLAGKTHFQIVHIPIPAGKSTIFVGWKFKSPFLLQENPLVFAGEIVKSDLCESNPHVGLSENVGLISPMK